MTDNRSISSNSENFSDEADSISVRDKALLKRSVSKHHNNNLRAGYVPVHEQHLTKTGLRGRKTFAFWTLVALIFILAIGNLLITVTILGVLRLGQGMESIELVPEAYAVKFYGNTDLGHLLKFDGKIVGFKDEPVEIISREDAVIFNLLSLKTDRLVNQIRLTKNTSSFWGLDTFNIHNKEGASVFSITNSKFNLLKGANILTAKTISTNRVVSSVHSKLKIDGKIVSFKGSEGTSMDGRTVFWGADQDVFIKTNNGSITLSATNGAVFDVTRIPVATIKNKDFATNQYKVCVCMPHGKLFRVPVSRSGSNSRIFCHHINASPLHNPCL